jgi:hypothetical protein
MTIAANGAPAMWNGSAIPISRPAINEPIFTTRKRKTAEKIQLQDA